MTVSAATFVASHCGETFAGAEGAKDLAVHMREAHGRKPLKAGDNYYWTHGELRVAPGWRAGEIEPPIQWTPPKRTGSIEQVVSKWGDEVEYFDTTERQEVAA